MVCIYCGHETEVYNSRERTRNPSVWRRRRCLACVAQFTTDELPVYDTALVVESVSGSLYPFSRDKLFLSLHKSLGHRSNAILCATELTETVIAKLLRRRCAPDGVLAIRDIAATAYAALKRFDVPAATTYRAYHQAVLD